MVSIKTLIGTLAIVGLTMLGAGTAAARDLDDAMRDLDYARADQARAEAELRAVQAQRAAERARERARDADFARFEAESRAAETPTQVYEYKRIGPTGTRYVERREYAPMSGRSYTEHYESW